MPPMMATTQPQSASNNDRLMDLDATMMRLGGDPELFACLLDVFLEEAPILLRHIEAGISGRDTGDEGARAAHNLRSLVASFDAHPAMATASAVERALAASDRCKAQREFRLLKRQIDQLAAALTRPRCPAQSGADRVTEPG